MPRRVATAEGTIERPLDHPEGEEDGGILLSRLAARPTEAEGLRAGLVCRVEPTEPIVPPQSDLEAIDPKKSARIKAFSLVMTRWFWPMRLAEACFAMPVFAVTLQP